MTVIRVLARAIRVDARDHVEQGVHLDLGRQVEVRERSPCSRSSAGRWRGASGSAGRDGRPSPRRCRDGSGATVTYAPSSSQAIGSPTATSSPASWTISASVPGGGRLHLDRRLVGLDLGDDVAAGDRVADPLEPAGHLAGLHVVPELGHLDRRCAPSRPPSHVPCRHPGPRRRCGASVSSRYHTGTHDRAQARARRRTREAVRGVPGQHRGRVAGRR